jgi:hypothetical protein
MHKHMTKHTHTKHAHHNTHAVLLFVWVLWLALVANE